MPYINRACDKCGKTDKPVHEWYQCVSGPIIEFKAEKIGGKFYKIVPKSTEYWCDNCLNIRNVKVEIKD